MKSFILIVLVALCHTSIGKPQGFEPIVPENLETDSTGEPQGFEPIVPENLETDSTGRLQGFEPIIPENFEMEEETIPEEDLNHEKMVESKHPVVNLEASQADEHDYNEPNCNCNKDKPKVSYGPEQIVKGKPETYIHHQPKIIIRQPPTHVRIEHPPTIIEPSAIVFRRHGKTIRKPVIYQHLPRDVQVRPVIVRLVKPIEKKIFVEKNPCNKSAKQTKFPKYRKQEYEAEPRETFRETYAEHSQEQETFRANVNVKESVAPNSKFD